MTTVTHINLNQPDTQCEFNKIGPVCNMDTVLKIIVGCLDHQTACQLCDNNNLKITMTQAGIVLVLSMITLDITVTNEAVNTFIFYANLIGINNKLLLCTSSFSSMPLQL